MNIKEIILDRPEPVIRLIKLRMSIEAGDIPVFMFMADIESHYVKANAWWDGVLREARNLDPHINEESLGLALIEKVSASNPLIGKILAEGDSL